jgi:hypothetical protein
MGGAAMGRRCVILSFLIALLLLSCSKEVYLPVHTTTTDSLYLSKYFRDSVFIIDSIYVREKGETVFVDKVRYKYIEKVYRDTIFSESVRVDSIPYPVEKQLTKWQGFYLRLGEYVFIGILMLAIILAVRLGIRFL